MKTKFKKGQKVVCIHYKKKPIVTVDFVIEKSRHISGYNGEEVWVMEIPKNKDDGKHDPLYARSWWGPPSWFKAIPTRKVKSK